MIDSHCHIAGEEFAPDLDAVVLRARAAGVSAALCIVAAGDHAEAARASRVRTAWPEVRFATGIHPHQAGDAASHIEEAMALVRQAAVAQSACAIGEIGLDYHYDFAPRPAQHQIFRRQVAVARELRLPVVIHTREAAADTFEILQSEGRGDLRGVFHCFSGDEAMARAALDIGFHVSFAGMVTFPRAAGIREAARRVPADRLLAETDSPYLAPVPHRGRRNEPALVVRVVEALAEIRGESTAVVAAQIDANFDALFGT